MESMRGRARTAGGIVLLVCAAILAVVALRTFVVESAHVHTSSMSATLLPGDFVLVNKLVYGPATPDELPWTSLRLPAFRLPALVQYRCGDIVLLRSASGGDGPRRFIKRIVGLPGDTLEFRSGVFFRNGNALPLPPEALQGGSDSLPPFTIPRPGDTIDLRSVPLAMCEPASAAEGHHLDAGPPIRIDGIATESYTVGERWYYVLGDNRGNSIDSRAWGCVTAPELLGRPVMIFWSREEDQEGRTGAIRWDRIGKVVR
jgi:signal peptidase I